MKEVYCIRWSDGMESSIHNICGTKEAAKRILKAIIDDYNRQVSKGSLSKSFKFKEIEDEWRNEFESYKINVREVEY